MTFCVEYVRRAVPPLFEPWSYADMSKLDVADAVYLHTILKKKIALVEDKVEQETYFHKDKKYKKIFNFNAQRQ
jgi:hypothetical protein